ncbi:MAG: nitrile hydratase subunit beta [Hyphomicrobiales bacterium]
MNGGHDLGGRHGLGPVDAEAGEPVFHDQWEGRAFAITVAMGATGQWTVDASRQARENQHPADYLRKSYYEIWLTGLQALLVEHGLLRDGEIETGKISGEVPPIPRVLKGAEVTRVLLRGASTRRDDAGAPAALFKPGDAVRAKIINPAGHTRLPAYARGRRGTIDRVHGSFVFADANAAGEGEAPQPCYSVRFEAADLWGADADPRSAVYVDLWQDHLELDP